RGPRLAGARSAVRAGLVAAQGELPDHVGREVLARYDLETSEGHAPSMVTHTHPQGARDGNRGRTRGFPGAADVDRLARNPRAEDPARRGAHGMLDDCLSCQGFVPRFATACPHCGAPVAAPPVPFTMGSGLARVVVAGGAGLVTAITLMA